MDLGLADLSSLVLFADVVATGSFTAAAERHRIAKSVVSQRIARLEADIGAQLLHRTTRKLRLTAEGQRFYDACARVGQALAEVREAVQATPLGVRGTVKINAPVTFAQTHLAAPLSRLLAAHPDLRLEVTADNRRVDVMTGGYDLVIRIGSLSRASFVARRLFADRLVVCAAPRYLAERGEPRTPADLAKHNCLLYSLVPVSQEWRFVEGVRSRTVTVNGNFSSSDDHLIKNMALAGAGLAVLPSFMVQAELREKSLVSILDKHLHVDLGVYALVPKRKLLPARTRVVLEALSEHFAR